MTHGLSDAVAATVRDVLKTRNLTQQVAAPILGMSQQALSDRLCGRTRFTLEDLERLAAHLQVPVAQLLEAPASLVEDDAAVPA